MDNEQIQSIFEKEGITTEILCGKAFRIAEKYGVPTIEIAKYCSENEIKIRACQLGCFT